MLRFSLLGFPYLIEWTFWLCATFIAGGLRAESREEWTLVAIRVGVILISITVHELGHALAGRFFGCRAAIILHSFGGLTVLPRSGGRLGRWQDLGVTVAGPFASVLLAAAAYLVLLASSGRVEEKGLFIDALSYAILINLFWTFINLLPILPLDGGQIFRCLLGEGPIREKIARGVGAFVALLGAVYFAMEQAWFNTLIFGCLAWANIVRKGVSGGTVYADSDVEPPRDRKEP